MNSTTALLEHSTRAGAELSATSNDATLPLLRHPTQAVALSKRVGVGAVGTFGELVTFLREAEESKRARYGAAMRQLQSLSRSCRCHPTLAVTHYPHHTHTHTRYRYWLEARVSRLKEYIATLERCVGVGQGGFGYKGATFKRSTQRREADLRYVATNMHVQEMRVRALNGGRTAAVPVDTGVASGSSGSSISATRLILGHRNLSVASEAIYETVTVGAFAAHVSGFKTGGIRQLRRYLETSPDLRQGSDRKRRRTASGAAAAASARSSGRNNSSSGSEGGGNRKSTSFLSANNACRAREDLVWHVQVSVVVLSSCCWCCCSSC